MKINQSNNGFSRADYLRQYASLDNFKALESSRKRLLGWSMNIAAHIPYYDSQCRINGNMYDLWQNHIYTVIVEISLIETDSYQDHFLKNHGTAKQRYYTQKLENNFQNWLTRLDSFIAKRILDRKTESDPQIIIARSVKNNLLNALTPLSQQTTQYEQVDRGYFPMLKAIKDINLQSDLYLEQIENCGDMDPALAILLVFIKNHALVVDRFNSSWNGLASLYREKILLGRPNAAGADSTELILTLEDGQSSLLVEQGTEFEASEELVYCATRSTVITSLVLDRIFAIYGRDRILKKEILIDPTTPNAPFDGQDSQLTEMGLIIQSPMLTLPQGMRRIVMRFKLMPGTRIQQLQDVYSVAVSSAEGWIEPLTGIETQIVASGQQQELTIRFTLLDTQPATGCCSIDVHGFESTHPVMKIVTESFPTQELLFQQLILEVDVRGARAIKLYNQMGELDSATPFYPFGVQAPMGGYFVFGSYQAAIARLKTLTLRGVWNQIPESTDDLEAIYRNYDSQYIKSESFQVRLETLESGRWVALSVDSVPLFDTITHTGKIDPQATFHFKIDSQNIPILMNKDDYELNSCRSGFFRVLLSKPSIGFGSEQYRQQYASSMIHNSRHKKQVPVPEPPLSPMLSDLELDYRSHQVIDLSAGVASDVKFYRLSPFFDTPILISNDARAIGIVEKLTPQNLVFLFRGCANQSNIRLYFDLIQSQNYDAIKPSILDWSYWNSSSNRWHYLGLESVLEDETRGLIQSGYIELLLPETSIENQLILSVGVSNDSWLSIRSIYLNCITVLARGGDGASLPRGTITSTLGELPAIKTIIQPFDGHSGRMMENESQLASRLAFRIANRNRAVAPTDYCELIMERFTKIDKVFCLSRSATNSESTYVVVMTRQEGELLPFTDQRELDAIRKYLKERSSPFTQLEVINPSYEAAQVQVRVVIRKNNSAQTLERLQELIDNYFAPWLKCGELPDVNKSYSFKTLHTVLINDCGVAYLHDLKVVVGETIYYLSNIDIESIDLSISCQSPCSVLIPAEHHQINHTIEHLPAVYSPGIGRAVIGENFSTL